MKKLSKIESIAKNIVDCAFDVFVNPEKYIGKKFDKDEFDIEKWIMSNIPLSYIRSPSQRNLDRALKFGKNYWKELLNGKS